MGRPSLSPGRVVRVGTGAAHGVPDADEVDLRADPGVRRRVRHPVGDRARGGGQPAGPLGAAHLPGPQGAHPTLALDYLSIPARLRIAHLLQPPDALLLRAD